MYNNEKQTAFCNNLNLGHSNNISISSYSYFEEPTIHPDRIMADHDLFYVIEGEFEVLQNNIAYTVCKDQALFLFAGQHHWGIKPCNAKTKTIFIHFKPNEGDTFSSYANTDVSFPVLISCQNNPKIKKYFETINYLYWSQENKKDARLNAYTNLLFCELDTASKSDELVKNEVIAEIIHRINSNLNRFFTVDELAKSFFISKRTLIYLFNKNLNTSPHLYQINMKLDICYKLLITEPNLKLKELAERFGFYDEYHLSKLFKSKFGVSPKRSIKNRK